MDLNIIIVGYNEEKNIPKMLKYLEYLRSHIKCRVIYIDQESTDNSVSLMKNGGAEIYIHPNKGYADPDKKRAIEELCLDNEWCFILDCDEEVTENLSNEIISALKNDKYDVYNVYSYSIILGGYGGKAYQPRLFIKNATKVTEDIHNYLIINSKKVGYLKSYLINDDRKCYGNEINVLVEKLNRYSDKEVQSLLSLSKYKIIINMFWKPILRFFGFGIKHKQFFRGGGGIILCYLMGYYQFLIYSKLYEKKFIFKKAQGQREKY